MWGNVRDEKDEISVHLESWGDIIEGDPAILEEMKEIREIVSSALEKRAHAHIKVRQPLSTLYIQKEINEKYIDILKEEVNVKNVVHNKDLEDMVSLDTDITRELVEEGLVREIIRKIQEARKKNNLEQGEHTNAQVCGTKEIVDVVENSKKDIERQTGTTVATEEGCREIQVTIT